MAVRALHHAAIYGNLDDIHRLADLSVIDAVDSEGQTALYQGARAGNFHTVKALVELGANAAIGTAVAKVACLHWLFMFDSAHIEEAIQLLLSRSANLSARTEIAKKGTYRQHILFEHFPFHWPIGSPFHWACFARSFPAMRVLLRAGVHVDELDDECDDEAQTPLGMVMYRGHADVVGFLIHHGAKANRTDSDGRNPLHMLALSYAQSRLFNLPKCLYWWYTHGEQARHIELVSQCVDLVVAAGGDINLRRDSQKKGNTPLLDSISSKDAGVALALMKAGADVSLCDELIILPLHHWASLDGCNLIYPGIWESVFRLLVDLSPELYETDYLGEGVFHHAIYNPSIYHFKLAMGTLVATPLRKHVAHRNIHGYNVLKSILLRKVTGGKEIELRFAYLLNLEGAVDLEQDDIGDLIWTTCRNDTLSDTGCMEITKRLINRKDISHVILTTKLYGDEAGILARDRGTRALMMAILNAQLETVKYLLQPGVDLQTLSINNLTILDYALHAAELLRRTGLERWSTHAPHGEPPRHRGHIKNRNPDSFKELFWAGEVLNEETGKSRS